MNEGDFLDLKVIPRSLHRPILFMGAERKPMLTLLGLVGSIVWFSGLNWKAAALAAALWATGHGTLAWMAQKNPQGCEIVRRNVLRFRFPLRATAHRRA